MIDPADYEHLLVDKENVNDGLLCIDPLVGTVCTVLTCVDVEEVEIVPSVMCSSMVVTVDAKGDIENVLPLHVFCMKFVDLTGTSEEDIFEYTLSEDIEKLLGI